MRTWLVITLAGVVVTSAFGGSRAAAADPFFSDDLSFVSSDPNTAAADQRLQIPLVVTNTSTSTWPHGTADSVFAVARIFTKAGKHLVRGSAGGALGLWTNLGLPEMAPGETRTIGLNVDTFGLKRGTYVIRADLVRGPSSAPTFFGTLGNPTPELVLTVR
jgi:hypothetical protein